MLNFDGLSTHLSATGHISNITNTEKMILDLAIRKLTAKGPDISAWLPAGTLPSFVHLPDNIKLNGTVNGSLKQFHAKITAATNRLDAPFATQIKAKASIQNLTNKDLAYLDVQLDTFYTSRADLLAYLPPDAIPSYMVLPDRFILSGTVKGKMANLESTLELFTYRNEEASQVKAIGNISGLFTDEKPSFDISLDAGSLSQAELQSFLPDSLLPAYLQLPFVKKLDWRIFQGDFDNFKTNFKLASNTGQWSVDAAPKRKPIPTRPSRK